MADTQRGDALNGNLEARMTLKSSTSHLRPALALAVAASLALAMTPSSAQTVTVPRPAPKARDNAPAQVSAADKAPMTTGATQAQPPTPIIPDPRRNLPSNVFATFDANQKAQAARVSTYLSSLST